VITSEDVDAFISAFDSVMTNLKRFPGPAWESLFRIARNALSGGSSLKRKASV
jgi:hypothetical protein